ncbi:MAG: ribosome-associated translation inhibitor RaiA [Actinobacteria bacterium]|nr:ribosome-associated translation inhibitor RaiA [Actinomycetota bacterium]
MNIVVKSRNCDVPGRLKQEAVDRLEHATRFFDRVLDVEMVFSEERNRRIAEPAVVELTARAKGHHIRAEGCGEDHHTAIDAAVSRFERQLARYKARLLDRQRGRRRADAPPAAGSSDPAEQVEPAPAAPRIVRRKRFEPQVMVPEDAALRLELLDHDFFVFTNAASGACNVVYRRRDGDLGLIELVE